MQKILIFGGTGFVGAHIAQLASSSGWDVFICSSSDNKNIDFAKWRFADIRKKETIYSAIQDIKPDVVINTAAIADIDKAERERDLAYQINVEGAKNIAAACKENKARYIFYSTDAIFDGTKEIYTEEDIPNPLNYYGQTKAEAEKQVLAILTTAIIIRISLVVGLPLRVGNNSFLAGRIRDFKEGKTTTCPVNEFRSPIDVHTLSECTLELADSSLSGIFNIASTGRLNRYELTKKLAELLGFDTNLVIANHHPVQDPNRAVRHKIGVLDVSKAQKNLKTPMLSIEETLKRAIK